LTQARVDPRVTQFKRMAAVVTHEQLLHHLEKEELAGKEPLWRRGRARKELDAAAAAVEARAAADVERLLAAYAEVIAELEAALDRLRAVASSRLRGKVDDERQRLTRARASLTEAGAAVPGFDFAVIGKAVQDADRELWSFGGPLVLELNQHLQTSAVGRELQAALAANQEERRVARLHVQDVGKREGSPEALMASISAYRLMAEGLDLVTSALGKQASAPAPPSKASKVGAENTVRVVPPQELERLEQVGGLDKVKLLLRRSLGAQLENADEAARYGVRQNSVLLYGPPGTGKTLLARAVAGEYGLRFIRVTPAAVASPYQHETARNLARVFDLARQSVPCLLFLDEVDAIGSARSGLPSAEHRELVTQLLTALEEFRGVPGLVIMGATNAIEQLDPALREGRFDTKIPVPLPDGEARREILEIHLRQRAATVAWEDLNLDEVVARTTGRSGAALQTLVSMAAEEALSQRRQIGQQQLLGAIGEREGRDRTALEKPIRWEDVVLPGDLEQRLKDILQLLQHPDVAETLGISPPAGVLLYGPPGTGKTTIAKALATEVNASFYEMSAADLLSKWVGESEERVAKLFATARDNRPSIIFIDEVDALLRRRSASSAAPWEERVVSQFLRELDGLRESTGVFLVGATNRLDIIDEAVRGRRLTPLEVPLPELAGRRALLERLFAKVPLSDEVKFDELARATDGMSGADLKRLRDEVGLKAMRRNMDAGGDTAGIQVTPADFYASLQERKTAVVPD